jgi:hypothetical protein
MDFQGLRGNGREHEVVEKKRWSILENFYRSPIVPSFRVGHFSRSLRICCWEKFTHTLRRRIAAKRLQSSGTDGTPATFREIGKR